MDPRADIIAVVISYQPDTDALQRQVACLTRQVKRIVVVDNGSEQNPTEVLASIPGDTVEIILLGKNLGVAAAQNIGIERAQNLGARAVLLMDQDSVPRPDMVAKLAEALGQRPDAAAVGCRYGDPRRRPTSPFVRVRGLKIGRVRCSQDGDIVEVDLLIASGSLIPVRVLEKVGGMREDFFIDYVDTEWCLRARRRGYRLYGACAARMEHSLGDYAISVLGLQRPMHSPLRQYYQLRNAVALYREAWVPWRMRLADTLRLAAKYILVSAVCRPRAQYLGMMTLGIWHGLLGKAGSFQQATGRHNDSKS
jgi:rhamnosyltransferase